MMKIVAVLGLALLCANYGEAALVRNYASNLTIAQNTQNTNFFRVNWNLNATHIQFGLEAQTNGWAAFGLSLVRSMEQADIWVASWVNNAPFLYDYNSNMFAIPNLDASQDVSLVAGSQVGNMLYMEFDRKLSTGDATGDLDLDPTTPTGCIWAINPTTPPTSSTNFIQHPIGIGNNHNSLLIQFLSGCLTAADCNNNGVCNNGVCNCNLPYSGSNCNITLSTTGVISTTGSQGMTPDLPPNPNGEYDAFAGDVKLYWHLNSVAQEIEFTLVEKGTGWVAFGIGDGMNNADMVMGAVVNGATNIRDAWSTGVGIPPQADSTNNILAFAGKEENGFTTIRWRRKYDTGDSAQDRPIVAGTVVCSLAVNPNSDSFNAQHTNRERINIDFFTGKTSGGVINLIVIHAILMAIAWAFLVPFAYLWSRYGKGYAAWWPLHYIANSVALILMIIALILAIVYVKNDFLSDRVIAIIHSWVGIIILIGAFFQPILGVYSNHGWQKYVKKTGAEYRPYTPFWPDKVHGLIGKVTMGAALVNIFIGFWTYDVPNWVQIIYGLWLLGFVIIEVVLEIRKCMLDRKSQKNEDIQMQQNK